MSSDRRRGRPDLRKRRLRARGDLEKGTGPPPTAQDEGQSGGVVTTSPTITKALKPATAPPPSRPEISRPTPNNPRTIAQWHRLADHGTCARSSCCGRVRGGANREAAPGTDQPGQRRRPARAASSPWHRCLVRRGVDGSSPGRIRSATTRPSPCTRSPVPHDNRRMGCTEPAARLNGHGPPDRCAGRRRRLGQARPNRRTARPSSPG